MASGSILSEVMLKEKLVELWPEYSCLYDVRSSDFKNKDRREVTMSEIAEKLKKVKNNWKSHFFRRRFEPSSEIT